MSSHLGKTNSPSGKDVKYVLYFTTIWQSNNNYIIKQFNRQIATDTSLSSRDVEVVAMKVGREEPGGERGKVREGRE